MSVWKTGIDMVKITIPEGSIKEIILDTQFVPDVDTSNNTWKP